MKVNSNTYNVASKGIVMPSVLFIMLLLGTLLAVAFLRLDGELEGVMAQSRSTRCLFIAEAGLERTISILRTTPNWRDGFANELFEDISGNTAGYYTVGFVSETAEPPWTRIFVTSTGMLAAGDFEYSRTIQAEILTANPAEFFAFTTDKAKITNMADIQTGKLYARELEFSISLLSPNDLTISQPTYYLEGPPTEVDPNGVGTSPDIVFTMAPTELDNPVAFPGLDTDYYKQLADPDQGGNGRYYSGDETFDGISLEEGENGVIFVDGDARIQGEIEDPVVVVASGNIYITGDITWTEDGGGNPVGKLGLFAKDDIYIAEEAPADINIRAQLIADGGIFETKGITGAKNTLNFTGSMAIRGGKDKEYGAVDLSVYGIRTYNYDPTLMQFPALPYVTYIAHLDSWKEQ